MEEKIKARIAELERAEQEMQTKLIVISNIVRELRALLETPTLTGDPLGD